MSSKTRVLQQSSSKTETTQKTNIAQIAKFSLAVLVCLGALALSILNDYLFFGWLSVSMAIILSLFAIHVIGEQQIKKQQS